MIEKTEGKDEDCIWTNRKGREKRESNVPNEIGNGL